jgi:TolA-binding protein
MALVNKAFCLTQIGRKEEAIKIYKQVLEEFPDSEMAKTSLKMLE